MVGSQTDGSTWIDLDLDMATSFGLLSLPLVNSKTRNLAKFE